MSRRPAEVLAAAVDAAVGAVADVVFAPVQVVTALPDEEPPQPNGADDD